MDASLTMAKRIAAIFLFWCVIYLLPLNVGSIYEHGILGPIKMAYWNVSALVEHPSKIIFQGTKVHLWFLVGLLCALAIAAVFVRKNLVNALIVFAVALYLVGVLAKAYANTPIGISLGFNTRDGPFFATVFFVSGYLMSGMVINERWLRYGCLVFLFGVTLHFSEIYTLRLVFDTTTPQDFVIGTYFMGLGVAMMALSNHPVLRVKFLGRVGQMTLGIYAAHFIFVEMLRPIDQASDAVVWEIGYVFAVFGLSLFTTIGLSKFHATRRFVS